VELPVAHQSITGLMLLRKIRMPDAIQIRQTGGPEVLNWTPIEVGERVAYAGPIGGYSEVWLIQADRPVKLPEAIAFDQAAAMMLQDMTAQVLIRQVYPIKAGDLILVYAAAGGMGLIPCQWAAALGATVIGTVSTEAKAELVHARGCRHTILHTKQEAPTHCKRVQLRAPAF